MTLQRVLASFAVLLVGCSPSEEGIAERYVGDLVERCAVPGFGQTRGVREDFELVLRTADRERYQTNIPICEPDATVVVPGTLELVEAECAQGEVGGTHHLVEGQLIIESDAVSVLYRWTAPGVEGGVIQCEVDVVLSRAE